MTTERKTIAWHDNDARMLTLRTAQTTHAAAPTSIETFMQTQLRQYFAAHEGALPPPGLYERLLAQVEKPLIAQTLRATGGNQIRAAEILGLNRNTLRKKMRALNIDAKQLFADAA